VEDQAKQSVIGPPSFGMPSYAEVEKKLKKIKGYGSLFKETFPKDKNPVTVDNFAKAVGAFERTLVTPSRFDAFVKGDQTAFTEPQKKGLKTFIETGCITCHSSAYMGGQMYQKFGVIEPYWKYTKSEEIDKGRLAVTKIESDRYVFKVPVLRNVEKTAPYFHDGSISQLQEAIWIMGKIQLGRDLAKPQLGSIIAFLKSLTGEIPGNSIKVPLLPPLE
jgi:cytochrome c peroxidase